MAYFLTMDLSMPALIVIMSRRILLILLIGGVANLKRGLKKMRGINQVGKQFGRGCV
jgi:hypothetical protein